MAEAPGGATGPGQAEKASRSTWCFNRLKPMDQVDEVFGAPSRAGGVIVAVVGVVEVFCLECSYYWFFYPLTEKACISCTFEGKLMLAPATKRMPDVEKFETKTFWDFFLEGQYQLDKYQKLIRPLKSCITSNDWFGGIGGVVLPC